ncbi:MAG: hypothetical protein RL341_1452 [Pseudomonadota bacterium]|jgi:hypothetical protein
MNRLYKFAASCVMAFMLAGCASIDPRDYAAEKPALDMKTYFNGIIDGYGMFQDRGGKVQRRFTVVIKASWQGDVGLLDEDFVWSDGKKEKRVWTLTKIGPNQYEGRAADVVGKADGVVAGNALNWKYVLALPVDGKVYNVDFDDWMFLVDERIMLNRAVMSKFGFRLGEVFISFKKR